MTTHIVHRIISAAMGAAFLIPLSTFASTLEPLVLREEFVSIQEGTYLLQPEPEEEKILAAPMLLFHRTEERAPADPPLAIRLSGRTPDGNPAEVEIQAIYEDEVPYVMPRRSLTEEATLLWWLPKSDLATSLTLSARSAAVEFDEPELVPLGELSLPDRLRAYAEHPLRMLSAAQPVRGRVVALQFAFPDEVRTALAQRVIHLTADANGRQLARQEMDVPLVSRDQDRTGEYWTLELSEVPDAEIHVRVTMEDDGGETLLAETAFDPVAHEGPYFDLPLRSIEGFHAMERFGELIIYTSIGDEGVHHGAAGTPLPPELIWVAAGNGEEWVLSEPVLRTRRDVLWMNGGPIAFGALKEGSAVHAFYSTAYSDGFEALSYANSINSLKLTPVVVNPVWKPDVSTGKNAPMIRGNAMFDLYGSRMVIMVLKFPGEPVRTHALLGNMRTRWNDLGEIPLPGLAPANLGLKSYFDEEEGLYYLLAGDSETQLFRSTNPLRDWEQVPIAAPEDWEDLQIVGWAGKRWLFGIKTVNGRGIVTWAPLDRDGEGFRVREEFTFEAPPLPVEPAPPTMPPPPPRIETNVR